MTERQVWEFLLARIRAGAVDGLCVLLNGEVDPSRHPTPTPYPVLLSVKARIRAAVRRHPFNPPAPHARRPHGWRRARGGAYGWPITEKGMLARAAFCERQIARLRRERRARRAA